MMNFIFGIPKFLLFSIRLKKINVVVCVFGSFDLQSNTIVDFQWMRINKLTIFLTPFDDDFILYDDSKDVN